MFEMVDESERERDIEHADRCRIQVVNGKSPKLEIESQNFPDEERLPDMLALSVDAEDPARSAALRFDTKTPAVTTNIEDALAGQVGRKTSLNHFPGLTRV